MVNLGISLQDLINGTAVMYADRIAGISHLIVVIHHIFLVGFQRDLFDRAIGKDKERGIAHGCYIHCSGPGNPIGILEESDNGFRTDLEQMMTQFRILKVIDIKLFTSDFECQILNTGNIDISQHFTVSVLQVFNLFDHVRHGMGIEYIGYPEFHHLILREIEGHGPGKRFFFKDNLTTEDCREHHHAEGDERFRLGIWIPQTHITKPLMKPFLYLHSGLNPCFRIEVVFFVEGDPVFLVEPVRVKSYT